MMTIAPVCGDIDSNLAGEYENITYVKTIERGGEYIVAIKSEPFFSRKEKQSFVQDIKEYLNDKYGINENNIEVVFDIEIIHLMKHADTKEEVDIIFDKVG